MKAEPAGVRGSAKSLRLQRKEAVRGAQMRFLDASAGGQNGLTNRRETACTPATDALVQQAVRRARAGDRSGVQYLYVRYAGDIQRYVQSLVRDSHDAEDITQSVFMKLAEALGRYEERGAPFSAWLLRVSRNAALDHLRQRRATPFADVHPVEPSTDDAPQSATVLREALATLPEDQRSVLLLRHVVGLSPGEIALRLGKSESAVHGLHHRGRGTLKSALTRAGAAPTTAASGQRR
jgi:RNA polymerase sigma-70 factor, ECF subfamily